MLPRHLNWEGVFSCDCVALVRCLCRTWLVGEYAMDGDGLAVRTSTTGEKVIPSSLTVSLSPASIVSLLGFCCSIPRMKPWVHWGMRGKSRNCLLGVSGLEGLVYGDWGDVRFCVGGRVSRRFLLLLR